MKKLIVKTVVVTLVVALCVLGIVGVVNDYMNQGKQITALEAQVQATQGAIVQLDKALAQTMNAVNGILNKCDECQPDKKRR